MVARSFTIARPFHFLANQRPPSAVGFHVAVGLDGWGCASKVGLDRLGTADGIRIHPLVVQARFVIREHHTSVILAMVARAVGLPSAVFSGVACVALWPAAIDVGFAPVQDSVGAGGGDAHVAGANTTDTVGMNRAITTVGATAAASATVHIRFVTILCAVTA